MFQKSGHGPPRQADYRLKKVDYRLIGRFLVEIGGCLKKRPPPAARQSTWQIWFAGAQQAVSVRSLSGRGVQPISRLIHQIRDALDVPFQVLPGELVFFKALKLLRQIDLKRRAEPVAKLQRDVGVRPSAAAIPPRFGDDAHRARRLDISLGGDAHTLVKAFGFKGDQMVAFNFNVFRANLQS